VHRLIQRLLRDELTQEQRDGYRHEAHLILAAAAPANPDDSKTWPRFRELLPHVNSDSTELPKSLEPTVRDLARSMMRYLYQSGDYASGLAMTERFMEQWTKDSGPESTDVLRAQRHLGNILRLLGRFTESYRVTEAALASCRSTLGESDPSTLSLRTSFGADLRARGKFSEARELDEESRVLLDSAYGPDDSRSLRLMSSLALDYGLISQYQTARDLYQDAFQRMSPSSSDATASDVLGAWIGLSWTLRLLGLYQDAYDVSEDARDFGQDAEGPGPEHLATMRSVIGYTVVCRRLPEKRREALELGRETLDLMSRRFGDKHPDTLAISVSVSNLLRTISEKYHAEALRMAENTVALYPGAYGEEHPYRYGSLGNLALLQRATGDPASARVLDEQALRGLTATLGADHHFTLTVAMNLASDCAMLGDPREARRIGEDTLPRLARLLGSDHPNTLSCAANLALDLMATGEEDTGKDLQARTLKRYEETQVSDFPDTVVAAEGGRLDPDFDPPPI
jgi:tetratricopeptide (TPR) repeat protein